MELVLIAGTVIVVIVVFGRDLGAMVAALAVLAVVAFYVRRGRRKPGDPTRY
jgi:hypothetical protein